MNEYIAKEQRENTISMNEYIAKNGADQGFHCQCLKDIKDQNDKAISQTWLKNDELKKETCRRLLSSSI